MENNTFHKALSNFTHDFASGDAIRHLFDLGYTIPEIQKKLDYPTTVSKISEIVWNYLVSTGQVCLEKPKTPFVKITYVNETDSFGRRSYRMVEEKVDLSGKTFVFCDFGKRAYRDKIEFEHTLSCLDPRDKEFILTLPWPLTPVYYQVDERMKRIAECLGLPEYP